MVVLEQYGKEPSVVRLLMSIAVVLSSGATAFAQAPQCIIPKNLPAPKVETPPRNEIRRAKVTGNILALSWSPQFCRAHEGDSRHVSQCGVKGQFGFILHGLWPEGQGRNDPAWCAPSGPLSRETIQRNFCVTPSAQLQQHEWQKHGTCATHDPDRYFKAASILYGAMKWPDMMALSFKRPTVAEFVQAFVAANPGLPFAAVRVKTSRGGWLEEVKICLDTDYRQRACPPDVNGTPLRARLKIWREQPKAVAALIRR